MINVSNLNEDLQHMLYLVYMGKVHECPWKVRTCRRCALDRPLLNWSSNALCKRILSKHKVRGQRMVIKHLLDIDRVGEVP